MLADDGSTVSLSDFLGQRVVLFYPKDNTPGCTTQACDFRDRQPAFADKSAVILGVSPDGEASHVRFRDKHDLNFRLLCDPEHEVAQAYGVWREKKNYGRTYMGIVRSTFLISPMGKITAIYDNVRAKGHAERILQDM
jgi:peroxiredoxin Q/BCP